MNRRVIFTIASAAVLFACSPAGEKTQQKEDILSANIDSTVNPADDFFQYAEGTWLKNNPIPGDQTSWGIGQLVQEEIHNRLKTIPEDATTR
jgi:putative endopeptidase